ncbi:MAG: hypothetical protein WCO16_00345 [bacterium]
MSEVQFEEYQTSNDSSNKVGIVNFLIKKGIVKTEGQATGVLATIAIIAIVAAFLIMNTTSTKNTNVAPSAAVQNDILEMQSVPRSE